MLITKPSSDNIERESLPTHVELNAHRIASIHAKISELEEKNEKLEQAISSIKFLVLKSIGVAASVITTFISLTLVLLDKIH